MKKRGDERKNERAKGKKLMKEENGGEIILQNQMGKKDESTHEYTKEKLLPSISQKPPNKKIKNVVPRVSFLFPNHYENQPLRAYSPKYTECFSRSATT